MFINHKEGEGRPACHGISYRLQADITLDRGGGGTPPPLTTQGTRSSGSAQTFEEGSTHLWSLQLGFCHPWWGKTPHFIMHEEL